MDELLYPCTMEVRIELPSEEEASRVYRALSVDDDEFIITSCEGIVVKALAKGKDPSTVRRAADDWLACLMAIMK